MKNKPPNLPVPAIMIILLIFRLFYYYNNLPEHPNGTKIRISARIDSEPIRYDTSQFVNLSGFRFYLPLYPRVYYGDRIVVEGVVSDDNKNKLESCYSQLTPNYPESTPGHTELDSESFLCYLDRFRNKFGMMDNQKLKNPKLVTVSENSGFLYKYRQNLISFYERNLPKDHGAIVSGVVIGSKSGMGEGLWNNLKDSGTAHVVVASGMNVSLVANFLIGFLIIFLPRRRALPLALVGIWIYALISGFDAPIVRASVMGSMAFLAVETGRIYRSLRTLLITGMVLIFVRPDWVGDLGFWLSTVATASIIIFYPKAKKILSFVPKVINENLSTTLAAQIGVVPILYYYFGQFNILSPLINVAVLWTIVPITIIGMVGGIIGTIWEPLGRLILYLCFPLTGWFLWIVSVFG